MARAKRKKPSSHPASAAPAGSRHNEDRTVVAVTVVWMLTLLCGLAAELAMLACLALSPWQAATSDGPNLARTAAGALLLAALVTGVLCLVLTPVVWRIRRIKPPLAIVVAAVLVGLAPLVTLVVLSRLF